MPRRPRAGYEGHVFHVLNRAARRAVLFPEEGYYRRFLSLVERARVREQLRLLAYCLMPTHFHLVVWPQRDREMSEFMRWLSVCYTQHWHARQGTSGTGPVFQGRFKSFPVQSDRHFLRLCRYVERNPVRAGLSASAEMWPWSSATADRSNRDAVTLSAWPIPQPGDWTELLNRAESESELVELRRCVRRGAPLGDDLWVGRVALELSLQRGLSDYGRPTGEGVGSRFSRK